LTVLGRLWPWLQAQSAAGFQPFTPFVRDVVSLLERTLAGLDSDSAVEALVTEADLIRLETSFQQALVERSDFAGRSPGGLGNQSYLATTTVLILVSSSCRSRQLQDRLATLNIEVETCKDPGEAFTRLRAEVAFRAILADDLEPERNLSHLLTWRPASLDVSGDTAGRHPGPLPPLVLVTSNARADLLSRSRHRGIQAVWTPPFPVRTIRDLVQDVGPTHP
jgi:hypothetical protein